MLLVYHAVLEERLAHALHNLCEIYQALLDFLEVVDLAGISRQVVAQVNDVDHVIVDL